MTGNTARMRNEQQEAALLKILIATGERAIEAFQASANINDEELLADLERVIARSRDELAALVESVRPG